MEYRQLPHGNQNEKFSVLGLGMGGIGKTPPEEIEAIIRKAIDHGINFFDMCTAGATYAPVGRAIAGRRDKVFLQVHFGISFHDKAGVLDQILTEYPQIEVVQIQLNYVDFNDASVESGKCLEVCRKHGKPVIVMEPVKGGSLVKLPEAAQKVFDELHGGSNASYAIRFAASQEGVMMVLSGMGSMEMMADNCGYMKDFRPLNAEESAAVEKVCGIFRNLGAIPCTACRYCTEVCPQGIAIPDLFACLNAKKIFNNWNTEYYYNNIHTKNGGKASDCLKCGKCEKICPQHLSIRDLLEDVAREFE